MERPPNHRLSVKVHTFRSAVEKRRALQATRQRDRRRDAVSRARHLALAVSSATDDAPSAEEHDGDGAAERTPEEEDMDGGAVSGDEATAFANARGDSRARKRARRSVAARRRFARQMQLPDWMTAVPADLSSAWFVLPRPEGTRCLVVSAGGRTVSRKRNGCVLHRFNSALPHGQRSGRSSTSEYTILDCIFQRETGTYYAIDLLAWKGHQFLECDAEFRLCWLQQKLADEGVSFVARGNDHPIVAVPALPCAPAHLEVCYGGGVATLGYGVDGLLFIRRASHYCGGSTADALVWKDAACSRFVVDTDADGVEEEHQAIVLELCADGALCTDDGAALGSIDAVGAAAADVRVGELLRFTIAGAALSSGDAEHPTSADAEEDGSAPAVFGVEFVAPCGPARCLADSWSKILFQSSVRRAPLPFDALRAALG